MNKNLIGAADLHADNETFKFSMFFSDVFLGVHQVVMVGFFVNIYTLKPFNHTWMSEGVMGK